VRKLSDPAVADRPPGAVPSILMDAPTDYLGLDDDDLLGQCDVQTYRASGPGGQHRNKVSSAVRLHHRPTGVTVQATESRSQHENRRRAVGRLRMEIACRVRRPVDPRAFEPPALLAECVFVPRGARAGGTRRIEIGRKDRRFWPVVAVVLDLLDALEGALADAAALLGVSTSNLVRLLKSDRHLLAAAQQLRKRHGKRPIA